MASNCSRPHGGSSTNSPGHYVGLKLKPMLVIVSNENVRTVVSLSLVWRVTHPART